MVTYYLGREEVLAYLRDLVERLSQFDSPPTLWCPLTRSGNALLDALMETCREQQPAFLDNVLVLPVETCEASPQVRFLHGEPDADIAGRDVLLFDGAIHTGQTMIRCVEQLLNHGARSVCSYALVLKRSSRFVPTLWGVSIADTDRAFFLLDVIPNNRLDAGKRPISKKKPVLSIHLRALSENHLSHPLVCSGVDSLDRVTWSDRFFDMQAAQGDRCTYVLEEGRTILGYVTLSQAGETSLSIDELAVDRQHQGKNLGAIMMRFADTMARQLNCLTIQLHAIAQKRPFYEGFGYRLKADQPIKLATEEYWLMQKPLLEPTRFGHG
ncbi:GNAT family N-acetyltransferase [Fontisphaera persica]|uniref:GNAT family N-acetyltransferase n=1 Tax=Fontisphaera persica TaxID=2974023 RepID=UPI0024C05BAC|nr:GNAT family N-acetyltransferase [Fontisphaera persica]WCJ58053.1 GNAT family N-acetyltransferase [Fontisphaera persica]